MSSAAVPSGRRLRPGLESAAGRTVATRDRRRRLSHPRLLPTVTAGAASRTSRSGLGPAAGSLFAFVVLGLPDGMLGVAWPSLRAGFGQPLGSLGELLLASLAGYLAITITAGAALRTLGTSALLMAAAVAAAAGAALIAAAPAWGVVVPGALLLGTAGGALDAALNTVVSLNRRPTLMNLLHASYGVGAALGPLLVTAALAAGSAWRGAYAALAILEVVLLAVWMASRRSIPPVPRGHDREKPAPPEVPLPAEPPAASRSSAPRPALPAPPPAPSLRPPDWRRLLLPLSLALFFCYTGLEASVGSWAASYLRGSLGLSAALSGVAVFLYWTGLTAGRLAAAGLGPRVSAQTAAWMGASVSLAGAVLVWLGASAWVTVAALPVIGLGLGPIFPALMTLTPSRLGRSLAVHAVGWQLAAAGIGGAGVSALLGVVLQAAGLSRLGPALTVLAALVLILDLVLERADRRA